MSGDLWAQVIIKCIQPIIMHNSYVQLNNRNLKSPERLYSLWIGGKQNLELAGEQLDEMDGFSY